MKKIQDVLNLKERKVLVRVDFNVPLGRDGILEKNEDWRIEKSMETINHLQKSGAKTILISHIGRDKKDSLKPVADYLEKILPIKFIPTLDREVIQEVISVMQSGDIILLENLRQDPGEEKNDQEFASFLASLGSIFVNEAFSVSHRAHASIVGVPQYLESYAGFWLQKEIYNLSKVLKEPAKPFLFILGGAKFETKIDLIKKFSMVADEVFIGGALANNFFQMIGFKVGNSLIDKKADVREFFNKENIKIPFDVVVKSGGSRELGEISNDDMIVDAGPHTLEELKKVIPTFATILWNGPLGLYEEGFDIGSKEVLKVIAESNNFSVIGGGDTVEIVKDLKLEDKISFISTGGGAMLEFLIKGTLPGIEVLEQ